MAEEIINKVIAEPYNYEFNVSKEGLYAIKISARAKSEKQVGAGSTDDDDLRIEIDGRKFPKLNNPQRYFDSPAAFSGGRLHNKLKIVYFLIHLSKGNHLITLIPDGAPKLEKLSVQFIGDNLSQIEFEVNQQAEDGDRRPWITFVLVDLPLKQLQIMVKTKHRFRDSDDLKLIVDDEIKINLSSYFRKLWFWLGSFIKGEIRGDTFETCLERGLHYIEFWADRTPFLYKVAFILGEVPKRIPNVHDPEWTGDFNDDSEQMILARAIFGEARGVSKEAKIAVACSIRNRLKDKRWGKTYREVILQAKQYSAFNKTDENYPFVLDPLHKNNPRDKESWLECYDIAGMVVNGKFDDPTSGANHYYSDYIEPPYWTKSKQAKFKIKIENFLFYYLGTGSSGSSLTGIIFFPLIPIILLLIIIPFFIVSEIHGQILWDKSIQEEPPIEEEIFIDFDNVKTVVWIPSKPKTVKELVEGKEAGQFYIIEGEVAKVIIDEKGELALKYLTNNDLYKSHLKISPDKKKIAFFQHVHKEDETFDHDNDEAREKFYNNHTTLQLIEINDNLESVNPREIYRGSYRTSCWEWLDNNRVMVKINAGTGYLQCLDINIYNGKRKISYWDYSDPRNLQGET